MKRSYYQMIMREVAGMKAHASADSEFRQRFIRGADLAANLYHPHIIGVHDRGEYDDQLWISMDYIDGTDAAALARDRYPAGMSISEAFPIAAAVADALDYAEDRGLLHRDVKPANILISAADRAGRQRILLADFGVARPLADPSGLTATNLTVGTISYAAPEQLMGEPLDGRVDQYAVAATVFHLLAGRPPYEHANPVAVIGQHLNADVPKISDVRPDLVGLDEVFAKVLAKRPGERFENSRQFVDALTGAVGSDVSGGGSTAVAVPVGAVQPVAPAADDGVQQRRWSLVLLAIAGIIVVVAGAVVVLHFYRSSGSVPQGAAPAPAQAAAAVVPHWDGIYKLIFGSVSD